MAQVKNRDLETKKVLDQLSSGRQLTQLVNSAGTEIGTTGTPIQVDIADATGITITADTEFPAAAAITDNFANPTTTSVMSMLMGYDGATWDRISVGSGAAGSPLRVVLATDVALPIGDNNIGNVDILTIAAGDTNIGNVDLVTLPAGNLGQQASAASLSVTPATNIADPTYIGDIRFGEALPSGTNLIGLVQPFAAVLEGGLTELIGINEQVAQNQYSGSVSVGFGAAMSGEILNIAIYQTEDDAGAILGESGVLFIYDADPTITSGDTTMAAADGVTVIGKVDITSGDWVTDTNTGVVYLTTAIGFHSLSSLFFAYKHTGATTVNSGATDDEQFEFNFWYRRDS